MIIVIFFLKQLQIDYKATANLVDSIVRTTIETNSLTTIVAIAGIALFGTQAETGLYFVVPQYIIILALPLMWKGN